MTKKHKVKTAFSIPAECYEALCEFTEVTGVSKSKFISDVLQENLETLRELTSAVRLAKEGKKSDANSLINTLEKSVLERQKKAH